MQVDFQACNALSQSAQLGAFGKEFALYILFRVARGRFEVLGSMDNGL